MDKIQFELVVCEPRPVCLVHVWRFEAIIWMYSLGSWSGRAFYSLIVLGKKECKLQSTFEWGIENFSLFILLLDLGRGGLSKRCCWRESRWIGLWRLCGGSGVWALACRIIIRRGLSRRFWLFSVFPWTQAWLLGTGVVNCIPSFSMISLMGVPYIAPVF